MALKLQAFGGSNRTIFQLASCLLVHPKEAQYLVQPPQALKVLSRKRKPPFGKKGGRSRVLHVCKSSVLDDQQAQGTAFSEPEIELIKALIGLHAGGKSASPQQRNDMERAVKILEGLEGVPEPTNSDLIEGRWKLMFTTRPGPAFPIQRTFIGFDSSFDVFQEVYLQTSDPRVLNIVKFSEGIGELEVESVASASNGKRILFQFDKAAFSFKFLPFKVPYPVPFRLQVDEAKGWLDTTYLSPSGNLRISRDNKGTTFVLQKISEPGQGLLSIISTGTRVLEAIEEFVALNRHDDRDELELLEGDWQMIWSSQMETDSWIENAANGLMGKQIIRKNGQLKFVVDIILGIKFSMIGTYVKSGARSYDLTMDDAAIVAGPFSYPVELQTRIPLELLYADERIRISRGFNGIVFVHVRSDEAK